MSESLSIAMVGTKGVPTTFGGIERHVEEIGARLAERGHRVTVHCRRNYTEPSRELCEVVRRRRWRYRGMDLRLMPSVPTKHLDAITHTALASFAELLPRHDIVHYHALGPSVLAILPRLTRRRVVATCHGLDWQRAKWGWFARRALRLGEWTLCHWPHRTIAVSRTLRQHFREHHGREVTYIPNGIDLPPTPEPHEIVERWGLRHGEYFLFLSRLVPEKRCDVLIEAFRGLQTPRRLVIAGGSSMSDDHVEHLHSLARGDDRILFTGNVTGRLRDELMTHAHAFVLPSELEGLPIVLLEALSFGLCTLASDIPVNREVLEETEPGSEAWGRLFRCNDVESLRAELRWLEEHPEAVQALGAAARPRVARHFTWDRVADETEALYREVAHGG
ncbi:glycosyltransferase family 4 protein [Candidatus Sumerlaeota bacterium]|nr:glycosyltransferase family 4 protein [Candidatus Sumerlaeota bacterium]